MKIKQQKMKWYDFFSNIYDSSLEKLYFESRKIAIESLDIQANETILDVACGTGANFKHIKAINNEVTIYGTDYSEGMLKKAAASIHKNNWNNINLFHADARELSPTLIQSKLNQDLSFDKAICFLGLSVVPDWELVLDNILSVLKPNGRIVIVDVYAKKRDFNTWLVEKIAKADLNRKIKEEVESKTLDFSLKYLPIKANKVGGEIFAAVGIKK